MADQLLAAPLAEPIHLDEAKKHLRVTTSDDDAAIARMIRAARRHAETWCRRAFVRQQRRLALDAFPAVIEIPVGPLRAVSSIQYLDTSGALQTLSTSLYRVDTYGERARITPAYGESWPSTYPVTNAVLVTYTAGHVVPVASFDTAGDTVTAKGHDLAADTLVVLTNSGGVVQSGLATSTHYYIKGPTTDTTQFATTAGGAAVDITATTAGTGQTYIGEVPDEAVAAMLLIVGHLYEHREENADFELFEMPLGAERLLAPLRTVRFC